MKLLSTALAALLLSGCASHSAIQAIHITRQPSQIQHIVILEMENRSFDHLFAAYPGVNGIPSNPTCNPDPNTSQCILPFHDTSTVNYGGPHASGNTLTDEDGGKMDGFVATAEEQPPAIDPYPDEVMGYHTCAEIPIYCNLAAQGTLADNNFAATSAWSTMAHLYLVSGWSAKCSVKGDPMSCVSDNAVIISQFIKPDFAWTDLTYALHSHGVSWGYYVYDETNPLLRRNDDEAPKPNDTFNMPGMWNPLPLFDDVKADGETANIQPGPNFEAQAASGTLPAVSWVIPAYSHSDHPTSDLADGQAWVQREVDAVRNGPDAQSTLLILTWDEWGGFYDHVIPPVIDGLGYGFRTPLILVGPMVKVGHIDHQLLSSDAYLKLIEDTFLAGARLDSTDGRPDSRPNIRENTPGLGDLRLDLLYRQ